MIETIYNVIPNYKEQKRAVENLQFEEHGDPFGYGNSTVYPGIAKELPFGIGRAIDGAVWQFIPKAYKCSIRFARKSWPGIHKPNDCHTDKSLGEYTSIVYLHSGPGTSFVSHADWGLYQHPSTEQEFEIFSRDRLDRRRWNVDLYCPAVENKMVLFDSLLMHRSEPEEGADRLVIVSAYKKAPH